MPNTDSYYGIGAGHVFCQDYTTHGNLTIGGKEYFYAVVSDGCSGSVDSDIGARVLAKAFPSAIRYALAVGEDDKIVSRIKERLYLAMDAALFNVKEEAFHATLLATFYDVAADTLHTFGWGDGVIIYRSKPSPDIPSSTGYVTEISYASNAPFYLAYQKDPVAVQNYERQFGDKYAMVAPHILTSDKFIRIVQDTKLGEKSYYEVFKDASKVIAGIVLCSDGVTTFRKCENANQLMPASQVYNELINYKSLNGEFVKRRLTTFKKFCQKEGWQHFDDISVAAINL